MFWSLRVVWLSATGRPLTLCWRKFFYSIFYSWGIFPQRKGYVAGLNFHKQWSCGWLQLPSETNHLIKKKWADRIDADHFQCGDMSPQREQQQPVNTSATWLQGPPVHLWITLSLTANIVEKPGGKSSITSVDYLSAQKNDNDTWGVNCSGHYSSQQHVTDVQTTWEEEDIRADRLINNIKNG